MPKTTVRPGLVIKEALTSEPGLSISQLYQAYKDAAAQAKERFVNRRDFRQRVMCYDSFKKTVWFARRLRLVEDRSGDTTVLTSTGEPLTRVEGSGDQARVVPATPTLLTLTPEGLAAQDEWEHLRQAYAAAGSP